MPMRHRCGASVKRPECRLNPLQDVQTSAPVDEVEQAAPVHLHVVARDPRMARRRLRQEVGHLAGGPGAVVATSSSAASMIRRPWSGNGNGSAVWVGVM